MKNNNENNALQKNTINNDAHENGILSTLLFMSIAILVMFLLRHFLNY